ncbi:hypothetical protein JYU34_012173 [Plutella xylostella]|uniref:Uncharacterized protein n=1 Tax=Plutella xylostella TaxID=51655 RepID=A0ABQ7QEK4_PLUXY|nr:hypothetical protein JYU34_012173 [Plutella xylostella]
MSTYSIVYFYQCKAGKQQIDDRPSLFSSLKACDIVPDDDSVFAACEAFRNSDRHASNPELSKLHVSHLD